MNISPSSTPASTERYDALDAVIKVSVGLTACDDPDISAPPPKGPRYAVQGPNDRIAYLPTFRDAIGAAGSGPLHAWINGAWFTSREARTPAI